ncbi:MAG: dihydrofolate reductase [Blastocatellia bacterium]
MIISLLVAMDEKGGIGKDNHLPWRLSTDLKRFRELTLGHHILVGRKTFQSIGRPLPGRQTVVVTRDEGFRPEGCLVARSVEDGIRLARERGESELFICGGAEIYAGSLRAADRMYMTLVHATVDADTFFPEWESGEWVEQEVARHEADAKNEFPFSFKVLTRKVAGRGAHREDANLRTGSES